MSSYRLIDSPIGPLMLGASKRGLTELSFAEGVRRRGAQGQSTSEAGDNEAERWLDEAEGQLNEYFAGERREFDLPLDIEGTRFQRRVWHAIGSIPYGETVSYAAVAEQAGAPTAYRAAGTACGANRVAIIIPCHRVVGSDRRLHGFGGGLNTKEWLLAHEGAAETGARVGQLALAKT